MIIVRTVFLSCLTVLLTYNPALAEGQKLREKLSQGTITVTADVKGCDEDAKNFCPGLEPGSQNAFMCMLAYEDKLSATCKLGIMEAAMSVKMGLAAIEYSVKACEQDADRFCLAVKPGEGRIVRCLRENEAKISQSCVTALKETGLWDIGSQ